MQRYNLQNPHIHFPVHRDCPFSWGIAFGRRELPGFSLCFLSGAAVFIDWLIWRVQRPGWAIFEEHAWLRLSVGLAEVSVACVPQFSLSAAWPCSLPSVTGIIMASQRCLLLLPTSCECVTLHGNRNFADVIKLKICR